MQLDQVKKKVMKVIKTENKKETKIIKFDEIIAPHFFDLHLDIKNNKYLEYMLDGGRGSGKSSFIAIELVYNLYKDNINGIISNAVIMRKVGQSLEDSVYAQILWAIDLFGLTYEFKATKKPMKIVLKRTGARFFFKSTQLKQDVLKLKSFKPWEGHIKYLWFEELNEFYGMEEVRSLQQSLLRGNMEGQCTFYSFNPPKSISSWVNEEREQIVDGRIVHHSNYLTVNSEWLGATFIRLAENLKKKNLNLYKHEYLGLTVPIGVEIFTNLYEFEYQEGIFEKINRGMDFGFVDPFSYIESYYDKENMNLYIFNEEYGGGWTQKQQTRAIKGYGNGYIEADSARPDTINELRTLGLSIGGVKKGPDSVDHGIKWLQDRVHIYIDKRRCPNTWREFRSYEYEYDQNGNKKPKYPDKNNHTIDAVRYANVNYIRDSKVEFFNW